MFLACRVMAQLAEINLNEHLYLHVFLSSSRDFSKDSMNVFVKNKIKKPLVCLRARTHVGATISVQMGMENFSEMCMWVHACVHPFQV